MSDYEEFDNTLYPDGTLKNKLGIHDSQKLKRIEYMTVATRSITVIKNSPQIQSIDDLYKIHRFLFMNLYDWAGKRRTYPLNKDGHSFMDYLSLDQGQAYINGILNKLSKKVFLTSKDYAELLDSLNELHPFREGNGRSAKLFLQCLAINHHQVIDYDRNGKKMIEALNNADIDSLSEMLHIEDTSTAQIAKSMVLLKRKSK